MEVVRVENLRKEFGEVKAVDGVSFSIHKGEIFGFLGPNGAGKTTTLSILSTLLAPTSGRAFVNGFDVVHEQSKVRRSIGVVFQDSTLDDELTAFENMDFHGRMYGMEKNLRKEKIGQLLELVELDNRKDNLVKTFSGGMKRRLEIARGILHEPKILFLDEPTLGLDPQTKNHLWQYIQNLQSNNNVTVILTTHYMDEAEKLSDQVAIIDEGKIVAMDKTDKLKQEIGGGTIKMKTALNEREFDKITWPEDVIEKSFYEGVFKVRINRAEERLPEIMTKLIQANIQVQSIEVQNPTLEEVFLHYTGKTIREEEAGAKERMRKRIRR